MANPSAARPHDPAARRPAPPSVGPQPPGERHGHRGGAPRRNPVLRVAAGVIAVAAAAAYPVYRFVLADDGAPAVDAQVDTCLAAFGAFMGEAPRPATVDCASTAARWRITAVFPPSGDPVPCRSLPAAKGYEAGFEWRDPAGGFLCLTVTPNTTYQDFGDVGTEPYDFNRADFDTLKQRLLRAADGG